MTDQIEQFKIYISLNKNKEFDFDACKREIEASKVKIEKFTEHIFDFKALGKK